MFRRHFPLDRISFFCADPSSLEPVERSELAGHLSRGCRRCWSALSDVAPGSVAPYGDPVAEALHHVATPQSLAVLTAEHLAAVRDVRRRLLGFAFLLLEEAFSVAWNDRTPEPLEADAFEIVGLLRPSRKDRRHCEDLYALGLAYLSMVRTQRGELDAARIAWVMAERHRHAGTGRERVRATVLEARALLAAALDDPRHAEELLTTAASFLAPGHPLRRFELYCRLADVLIHAGEGGRVPETLARANVVLTPAHASSDPILRAQAVYAKGKLTAYLAARLAPSSAILTSAIRWAAAELEAAGEKLFATSTDLKTQETRLLCLIRLYSYFDRERAAATCKKTMVRFNHDPYLMTTSDPELRDLRLCELPVS